MGTREPLREIILNLHWDIDEKGISAANRKILRRIEGVMADIDWNFKQIYRHYHGYVPKMAWQFAQITDAMLESSDDPDGNPVVRSVLTTASQSENEFNWMMSGGVRGCKVVLGPGAGVPSHYAIIDKDDANLHMLRWKATDGEYTGTESNVCRPYGMGGLKLQFGSYKPDGDVLKFWPSSVAAGTFCYLEQTLPMVDIV